MMRSIRRINRLIRRVHHEGNAILNYEAEQWRKYIAMVHQRKPFKDCEIAWSRANEAHFTRLSIEAQVRKILGRKSIASKRWMPLPRHHEKLRSPSDEQVREPEGGAGGDAKVDEGDCREVDNRE